MIAREWLNLGGLNDGLEAKYSGTDVPRLWDFGVHAMMVQEADREYEDLLDDADVYRQGELAVILRENVFAFEGWVSTPLSGQQSALCVRVDYLGAKLSLISGHRQTKVHADKWPEWNTNLGRVFNTERALGRIPIGQIDSNTADHQDITDATKTVWKSAYVNSIDGFLLPTANCKCYGVQALRKEDAEHFPIFTSVRIPIGSTQ